jgi:hypothetical protein
MRQGTLGLSPVFYFQAQKKAVLGS